MTTPPSTQHAASRWKQALAWAFGLGLLGWLLARTPMDSALHAARMTPPAIWVVTVVGLLLSYGLRAARLQVVLSLDDMHQPPGRWLGLRTDALRVILQHNAAINLLPMRAGELSFPWFAARELKLPVARAIVCLIWMRLQDLVVLLALGLALWPGLTWWLRLVGLIGLFAGWHAGWWALQRLLRQADSVTPHAGGWRALAAKLQSALLEPAHHRPAAWLLTLANWAVKLAAGATLLSAISQAPWTTGWGGALGGELAAVLPLQGPAGFGTYEAGVWAGMATLLPAHAAPLERAVGAALALHLCFLLCAVLAGAVAAGLSHSIRKKSPLAASAHSDHP